MSKITPEFSQLPPPTSQGGGLPIRNSRLGTYALLAAISMLFAGFMMVYTVLRFSAPQWPPAGVPRIPGSIWVSTVVILLSSGCGHMAMRSIRRDFQGSFRFWMLVTLQLGAVFCVTQYMVWEGMVAAGLRIDTNLYATNFYAMSMAHIIHVLGGMVYLGFCAVVAMRGGFSSNSHDRVGNCMLYWHFVTGIWLFLFLFLYLV